MTQCVLEAYGKMFGSDYNNVVDLKMALSTTAGKGNCLEFRFIESLNNTAN